MKLRGILRLALFALLLAACGGEVDSDRRAEAVALAESIETPQGFERTMEIVVEDPSFGILGNEPGSIVHEWAPLRETSTEEVFDAFDPALSGLEYVRVALSCTDEQLSAVYWHPLTGTAILNRLVEDGDVFITFSTSWDNEAPMETIEAGGADGCPT